MVIVILLHWTPHRCAWLFAKAQELDPRREQGGQARYQGVRRPWWRQPAGSLRGEQTLSRSPSAIPRPRRGLRQATSRAHAAQPGNAPFAGVGWSGDVAQCRRTTRIVLLAMLQAGPEELCTRCAGVGLNLDDRWAVLKAVRELIMLSAVLCRLERCGMCDRPETVITLRRPRRPTTSAETTDRVCPRCRSLNVIPV